MLSYTPEDVVASLRGAKNLNAAVKNFLKKDVGNDARIAQFAKELRAAFESPLKQRADLFIRQSLPQSEIPLIGVVRYCYVDGISAVVEQIAAQYAEEFGATYQQSVDGVEIKDRATFERIISEVVGGLGQRLEAQKLPASNFMKNAVLMFLFEADVLKHVIPLLREKFGK